MKNWTRDEAIEQYQKRTRGLQYTIGERERIKALWFLASHILTEDNGRVVSEIMRALRESPAGRAQDIFALLLSHGKKGGYFVEFGACDGLAASNSWILESRFGWKGILAEPAPVWHERLQKNRTAAIDKRCLSANSGEHVKLYQEKRPGLTSLYSNNTRLEEIAETNIVETVSLLDLLKEHRAPNYIDFLSVDCEGHEKEILKGFDFDKYKFGFICVEQHLSLDWDNDVSGILAQAGYAVLYPRDKERVLPMEISGVDLFFVPTERLAALTPEAAPPR